MNAPGRLDSLDAFCGFTIAAMVLVNNPGDWSNLYSQLAHAKWHGWTFTDTIFPFFLFIGGVSIPHFNVGTVRIPGALQRIALCTLLAAPIVVYCGWRLQLAMIVGLLTLYSALMLFYPVPGSGAGLLFAWLGVICDAILMPINKSLWTPLYCVLMTGWALLVFSGFFWLLDVNPYRPCARRRHAGRGRSRSTA